MIYILPLLCIMQTHAEVNLAAYETLVPVLRVLASTYCTQSFYLIEENKQLFSEIEVKPELDYLCVSFIQNINDLLGAGILARTRRAVLLDIKVLISNFPQVHIFIAILSDSWIAVNLFLTSHIQFHICLTSSVVPMS